METGAFHTIPNKNTVSKGSDKELLIHIFTQGLLHVIKCAHAKESLATAKTEFYYYVISNLGLT